MRDSWIVYAVLATLLVMALACLWYLGKGEEVPAPVVLEATTTAPFTLQKPLYAKAAYVYDVSHGKVLFERNGELQLPLASITKLMTALTASDALGSTDAVVITDEALAEEGPSGLSSGEKWSFKNLLDFTLVASSNDGAHAIAGAAGALVRKAPPGEKDDTGAVRTFVEKMNSNARTLGMTQTYFLNPTGLDETEGQGGAYGSARDVATLMSYMLRAKPELLSETRNLGVSVPNLMGEIKTVKNTNQDIGNFPLLIASKTGFTDLAGGNLAIAFDAGLATPIVVVVLGSTEEGRFVDAENLVQATLAYLGAQ